LGKRWLSARAGIRLGMTGFFDSQRCSRDHRICSPADIGGAKYWVHNPDRDCKNSVVLQRSEFADRFVSNLSRYYFSSRSVTRIIHFQGEKAHLSNCAANGVGKLRQSTDCRRGTVCGILRTVRQLTYRPKIRCGRYAHQGALTMHISSGVHQLRVKAAFVLGAMILLYSGIALPQRRFMLMPTREMTPRPGRPTGHRHLGDDWSSRVGQLLTGSRQTPARLLALSDVVHRSSLRTHTPPRWTHGAGTI